MVAQTASRRGGECDGEGCTEDRGKVGGFEDAGDVLVLTASVGNTGVASCLTHKLSICMWIC